MEERTGEGGEIMVAEEQADMMAPAERAAIDIQITTAKHNPRSITTFYRKAKELATLDRETAKSCIYSIPRGGKAIVGANVRLAEIVAACWGNIRVKAKATHHDGKFAYAEAVAWDLENNTAIGASARQPLYPKRGKALDQDTIANAMGAAESKALRNAIFKVVPQAVVRPIYLKVCDAIGGSEETMDVRRQKMMAYWRKRSITAVQVYNAVGVAGVADITIEHMLVLHGIAQAIKDGVLTLEAAFPPEMTAEEKLKAGRVSFGKKGQKEKDEAKAPEKQPPAEDQAGTFVCGFCGFKAKSKRGLGIHESKCKSRPPSPSEPAPEPTPEPEPQPPAESPQPEPEAFAAVEPEPAPPSEPAEQAVPSDGPAVEAPEVASDPTGQADVDESPPVVEEQPEELPPDEPAQDSQLFDDTDLTSF